MYTNAYQIKNKLERIAESLALYKSSRLTLEQSVQEAESLASVAGLRGYRAMAKECRKVAQYWREAYASIYWRYTPIPPENETWKQRRRRYMLKVGF